MIPSDALGLPSRHVRDLTARPLGVGLPLAGVVASALRRMAATAPAMSDRERDMAEEPIIALARALLTACAGDAHRTADALGAILDICVIEYLRLHLRDRDVGAARVATVHGISERHLYTVLARHDITLRAWLRHERLAAAARFLSRPAGNTLTIAAVAHHWGFADHAHFTREFRKQFGITPTARRDSPRDAYPSPPRSSPPPEVRA
jgi:AraC-like DNA-binding protein